MTTLENTQPGKGGDANTKSSKWTRYIPAAVVAAMIVAIGVFMNVGLLQSALDLRAEYNDWGPRRVAAYYGDCLDARYGLQHTSFDSKSHNTTATERQLRSGRISNQQVDTWLEELKCSPLPAAAYEYRKPE